MMSLLRRRMMMAIRNAEGAENMYFKSGILTVDRDINSLDTENIWDKIELFDLGLTDLPEHYGILLERISAESPVVDKTVCTAYWSSSESMADNASTGNFDTERAHRNIILMSTINQVSVVAGTIYLLDGALWQTRYNTEWHYNVGDEYFWCVYETPRDF